MAALFVERESEVLRTIGAFADAGLEFVVVGGYAVSCLGRHRFSVDLDVVIDRRDLDAFTKILEERGGLSGVLKGRVSTRSMGQIRGLC